MKKYILHSVFFVWVLNGWLCAQNFSSPQFQFCKQKGQSMSIEELKKCPKLVAIKNKKIQIKSFVALVYFNFQKEKDSLTDERIRQGLPPDSIERQVAGVASGIFLNFKSAGDSLPVDFFEYLEKRKGNYKILIEEIVAVENEKEGKYTGFTFYLHKQ